MGMRKRILLPVIEIQVEHGCVVSNRSWTSPAINKQIFWIFHFYQSTAMKSPWVIFMNILWATFELNILHAFWEHVFSANVPKVTHKLQPKLNSKSLAKCWWNFHLGAGKYGKLSHCLSKLYENTSNKFHRGHKNNTWHFSDPDPRLFLD